MTRGLLLAAGLLLPSLAAAQPKTAPKKPTCLVSVIQAGPGKPKGPPEVDAALRDYEPTFKSPAWKRWRSFKIVNQARYESAPGTSASLSVDKDQVLLSFSPGPQADGKLRGTFGLGKKAKPFTLSPGEVVLVPAAASGKGQRLYGLSCPAN